MTDATPRILLVGGDEFRPACLGMDEAVLRLAMASAAVSGRQRPRVAIIPTAAAFENPQRAADNGIRHFKGLGADAYAVLAIARADADNAAIAAQVAGADLIYFTGGSPEHLRDTLAGSALLAAVRQAHANGAIWAGSSAGAMVLGERMRRPSATASARAALGIISGIMVLPHHENSDPAAVAAQLAQQGEDDLTTLGIDGAAGILLEPDGATALGSGRGVGGAGVDQGGHGADLDRADSARLPVRAALLRARYHDRLTEGIRKGQVMKTPVLRDDPQPRFTRSTT